MKEFWIKARESEFESCMSSPLAVKISFDLCFQENVDPHFVWRFIAVLTDPWMCNLHDFYGVNFSKSRPYPAFSVCSFAPSARKREPMIQDKPQIITPWIWLRIYPERKRYCKCCQTESELTEARFGRPWLKWYREKNAMQYVPMVWNREHRMSCKFWFPSVWHWKIWEKHNHFGSNQITMQYDKKIVSFNFQFSILFSWLSAEVSERKYSFSGFLKWYAQSQTTWEEKCQMEMSCLALKFKC